MWFEIYFKIYKCTECDVEDSSNELTLVASQTIQCDLHVQSFNLN